MCEPECPNQAIYMGELVYEIDSDLCTECVGHYDSPSCISVCPIDCIALDPEQPESEDDLRMKFTRIQGQLTAKV